jgi:hypothetical protein
MTGAQIRAARGFLWSVRDLGKKAKVHFNTVHAIERVKSHGKPETLAAIRNALEKAGVRFTSGKRPGGKAEGVGRVVRAAHSEPLHLAACHLAGGGAGCLRWDRRARGD